MGGQEVPVVLRNRVNGLGGAGDVFVGLCVGQLPRLCSPCKSLVERTDVPGFHEVVLP